MEYIDNAFAYLRVVLMVFAIIHNTEINAFLTCVSKIAHTCVKHGNPGVEIM